MGAALGIKMKKGAIFAIRGCFRLACNHPLLLGNLCFLIFLHRSFPFIFSLLVSVSPVLICTGILLGAFLSFGQPAMEIDEQTPCESVLLENEVSRDAIVVEQNEARYCAEKGDGDEPSSSQGKISATREQCDDSNVAIESCNNKISVDEAKDDDIKWNGERLGKDGEVLEKRYVSTQNEDEKSDDERSMSFEAVSTGSLNSLHSCWKHLKNEDDDNDDNDDDDDDDDDDVDEGSVGSGESSSSSPHASMADTTPMLEELHPLLDEDSSNPVVISRNASGLASERSSSTSSMGSVDEIEDREGFNEDEDDEGDKDEEPLQAAIAWTEEDQRNLMDLGSSEIERNQRLENLILRRKRRMKNVSMVPEINLIDLEGVGSDFPPPHVAPISTVRHNPFDLPYENVPGSAPSVLLQRRRNPFELYEMGHERGESLFRRRESFGVGPVSFAGDAIAARTRPYFAPETGFSSLGHQSSGLSDSKTNSAPDTESVGSLEDQKLPEEYNSPWELSRDAMPEAAEDDAINEPPPQLISDMNHVSEHIGHGSQSSDYENEDLPDSGLSGKGDISELNDSCSEAIERTYGGGSSCSSTSENEGPAGVLPESGEIGIEGVLGDENPHREPVYDSSPHSVRKNMSSSSITSDVHVEPGTSLPPVVVKRSVSFAEGESGIREVDSDGDYHEANEKLLSTPSAGGSTSHFHNITMHEPNFEHREEVPVPNTPVEPNEKVRAIHNLNIPKIYELDHDTSSSLGSPFSPDFISMPSSPGSHVDVRAMQEEADDDIKEIDGVLLSELDSTGDFSVTSGSGSNADFEESAGDHEARASRENQEFDESTFSKEDKDSGDSLPENDDSKRGAEGSRGIEVEEHDRKLGANEVDERVSEENEANIVISENKSAIDRTEKIPYDEANKKTPQGLNSTASIEGKCNKSNSSSSSSSSSSEEEEEEEES